MKSSTKDWLLPLALLLAGLACYLWALPGPLFFDDQPNIVNNPHLDIRGATTEEWRTAAASANSSAIGRPLAMLSFAANHALAGKWVAWQLKAVNLLVHLCCAALLYRLVLALCRAPALQTQFTGPSARWLAFGAAAIWFLHPLQVSTVLYAVQRMAQLSTLLVLAGLYLYTAYRLRWLQRAPAAGEVVALLLWLGLVTLLAVLAKENGILLPLLVLVLEAVLFRCVLGGRPQPRLLALCWLAVLGPFLLVALLWCWPPEWLLARYAGREFTLDERMWTQGRVLWHYIAWFAWPDISHMGFQHDDIPLSTGWRAPVTGALAWLGWAVLLAAAPLLARRLPLLVLGLLFFLAAQLLESSLWPLEMVYEHRNYLPSIGLAIAVSGGLAALANRQSRLRLPVTLSLVMLVLVAGLALRAGLWRDALPMYRAEVINHPESPRSRYFLGQELFLAHAGGDALPAGYDSPLALILDARSQFATMHALDGRDLAPVVMLYQIDQRYFPGAPGREDWLGLLAAQLADRRLQASDIASLKSLVRYVAQSPQGADFRRVRKVVDSLQQRYPDAGSLHILQLDLAAAGGRDSPRYAGALAASRSSLPGYLDIYPYHALAAREAGDTGRFLQVGGEWLAADHRRRHLSVMRQLYSGVMP